MFFGENKLLKHFGDVLSDYLLGNIYVSFSEEETERILKSAGERREHETGDALKETKEI